MFLIIQVYQSSIQICFSVLFGSTEYTTGTVVSGNTITFTVPHDAPSTLYYYCTNHSGMGNSISVTTDTN